MRLRTQKRINIRHAEKIVSRRMQLHADDSFRVAQVNYLTSLFDTANCAAPESVFNTGIPPCDLKKKKMKGVIFTDAAFRITPVQAATSASLLAYLRTASTAARGLRIYPLFDLQNLEDNTGDPATGAIGNLTTATFITSDSVPGFRFGYDGTELRHQRMSAMNGMSLRVFLVDEQYAVYGTRDGDNMMGFSVLQAYGDTSKFPIADAVNQYAFRITLGSVVEYRDLSRYVVLNSGLLTIQGLINVQLTELSKAANVFKIQPIADGGTNLEPQNGAAIAGLTFTAIDLQTGDPFIITSAADDTALDAITITGDSTAWTALASGDQIQLYGPTAAALSGAGVKPYEFLPVIITKP